MSYTLETGITGMTYSSQQNYIYGDANWKDKLTAVDGNTITYDAIGNLVSYNGYTFEWEQGRQLDRLYGNGVYCEYAYDLEGLRTSKFYNGITYNYTWINGQLSHQAWDNNYIHFYYDGNGIIGFDYNGTSYTYVKNIQGDVIGIVDNSGILVAEYEYDAWGKLLSATGTMANINPIRYRGYYYDSEIAMYYLQSRYYDPSLRRFVNEDAIEYMGVRGTSLSFNLFAYCENIPTVYKDVSGYSMVRLEDDPDAYDAYYRSHWEALKKLEEKYHKTYSGVVGFGMQIMLYTNIACYQGFVGVEALWFAFTDNNNFGNGLIPWTYCFAGGSMGLTLDFDELLSPKFLNNPKNVLKGFGLGFSLSISISFFLITANNMSSPDDYTRDFQFWTGTVYGVTISKAWSDKISTYGIGLSYEFGAGISFGKKLFGATSGASYYWAIPIGSNAAELYDTVKSEVQT